MRRSVRRIGTTVTLLVLTLTLALVLPASAHVQETTTISPSQAIAVPNTPDVPPPPEDTEDSAPVHGITPISQCSVVSANAGGNLTKVTPAASIVEEAPLTSREGGQNAPVQATS
jgi:hypothetical protein